MTSLPKFEEVCYIRYVLGGDKLVKLAAERGTLAGTIFIRQKYYFRAVGLQVEELCLSSKNLLGDSLIRSPLGLTSKGQVVSGQDPTLS